MYQKNIGDSVRSRGESIGTPLDPPLIRLDNIFTLNSHLTIDILYTFIQYHIDVRGTCIQIQTLYYTVLHFCKKGLYWPAIVVTRVGVSVHIHEAFTEKQ
jgi:hypothetical protein